MNNKYHSVTQTIVDLLKSHNMWFQSFEHEPVRTSEEAALLRPDYSLDQGAKAIILKITRRDKTSQFIMIVLSGSKRLDSKKVKKLLDVKELRFATEEEVVKETHGVLPGGVPPFGNLFNMPVYMDTSLLAHEKIIFNAGDRSFSIGMYLNDYLSLVAPKIENLSVEQ